MGILILLISFQILAIWFLQIPLKTCEMQSKLRLNGFFFSKNYKNRSAAGCSAPRTSPVFEMHLFTELAAQVRHFFEQNHLTYGSSFLT